MLHKIDLSRVDLNLLVLFEAVMDTRHVGRAGDRLNLSPSAVSHGLGRLRKLLDDPVFLRIPKGVVPTDRALTLAEPISEILAKVRAVVASAEPFDPKSSTRRFVLGGVDGITSVLLAPMFADLRHRAPRIDVVVRTIQQDGAFGDLDGHVVDIALIALSEVPARFVKRVLYDDHFAIAMQANHPFAADLTLQNYCEARHLLVSIKGDARGFVDDILESRGLARRVAVTVPNFFAAMAVLSETDFIAALPRRMLKLHGARFGLTALEPPIPMPAFPIHALVPQVALRDAGIAWLFDALAMAATGTGSLERETS